MQYQRGLITKRRNFAKMNYVMKNHNFLIKAAENEEPLLHKKSGTNGEPQLRKKRG